MKSAVLFEGIPVVFSDDDMIHHIDSHRLGDLHELMGRCDIATGRGRVVGWMVVYKKDRIRVIEERFFEYFARMDQRLVERANKYDFMGNDLPFCV